MKDIFQCIHGIRSRFICGVTLFFLSCVSMDSQAAFCSLRNPVAAIKTLFPSANQHRTVVRNVSKKARARVEETLPITLHYNEIGRHTVYIVFKEDIAVGVVHARSEASSWGLIEIAWALDMHLNIKDFYFQRCRMPSCNERLKSKILKDIKGKSLSSILPYFDVGGKLKKSVEKEYKNDLEVVRAVFSSALKTIQLTESEWGRVVRDADLLSKKNIAKKELGIEGKVSVNRINTIHRPDIKDTYYQLVNPDSIKAYSVTSDDRELARIVEGQWMYSDQTGGFIWLFSPEGRVLHIEMLDSLGNTEINSAFKKLSGVDISNEDNCNTPVELTARDMYLNAY